MDRRPRQNHRRCETRAPNVKFDPLATGFSSMDIMSFITPQIAMILLVTLVLLIATLVLVTLAVRQ